MTKSKMPAQDYQVGPGRSPDASRVTMTELVLPQHTNALGTVFGGVVMSWVDIAAATCALRHCNKPVVTASIDALHFLAPIKLGWVVTLLASINYASKKSCEIGVRILAENPITSEKYHTATAYLTFVPVDGNGNSVGINPVLPETQEDHRRYSDAQRRRQSRLKLKEELQTRQGSANP